MAELTVHNGKDPIFIGLLIVVSVLFGVFFRVVLKKIPVPYTLLCLFLGLILGEIVFRTAGVSALGDSINLWLALDPHTILFMFLPPLIYESASSMDYHTFVASFYQSLLLAVPGVLISAGLTGLVAMYVLPHGWDFVTAMTLGSILAATDPVAVVALLRELGAPRTLATVIEGESLLNDGIAFVMFQFFLAELQGEIQSIGSFLAAFVYKSIVASIVGWYTGKLITFMMGLIFDDAVAIVMLSASGALGAFYIVEGLLEASGVLGVVAFGVAFASRRSGNIAHGAFEAVETVWESLGFLANTLVFVYSGIIIVNFLFHSGVVQPIDYMYLLVLYALLHVIRAIAIVSLSPFLSRTGYGFNYRQGLLFAWSGLRGAVGLTLGLFVVNDLQVDRKVRSLIMFYVAGIAALTLLINGTTAGHLVRYLEIDRSSAAAKVFYANVLRQFQNRVESTIAVARREENFKGTDWSVVWSRMPVLSHDMQRLVELRMGTAIKPKIWKRMQKNLKLVEASYVSATMELVAATLVQDARHRFLNLVKSTYNAEFEHGARESRPAFQILVDAATEAQDRYDSSYSEWATIQKYASVPQWMRFIPSNSVKHLLVDWRLALGYELAAVFIKVHVAVEREFIELTDNGDVADVVLAQSHQQMLDAQSYLDNMNTDFADITGAFKTRWASQWVLRDAWVFAQELYHSGEIESKELNSIVRSIDESRGPLLRARFSATKPQERIQVLRNSDLFEGLSVEDTESLLQLFQEQEFLSDENIAVEGEACRGVYLITNGKVEMSSNVNGERVVLRKLTSGDLIGDYEIVTHSKNKWSLTCVTNVRGYFLKHSHMIKLLDKHKGSRFERNVYVHAGISILQFYHILESGNAFTPEQSSAMLQDAQLLRPGNDCTQSYDGGMAVLFVGQCMMISEVTGALSGSLLGNNEEWLFAVTRMELLGTWTFRNDACLLWVPDYDVVSEMPSDRVLSRATSSVDYVATGTPKAARSRRRSRTASSNTLGFQKRQASASFRNSRNSRRSQRSTSNGEDNIPFGSAYTPRTLASLKFEENPLVGISDINIRVARVPAEKSTSTPLTDLVSTPGGSPSINAPNFMYRSVSDTNAYTKQL